MVTVAGMDPDFGCEKHCTLWGNYDAFLMFEKRDLETLHESLSRFCRERGTPRGRRRPEIEDSSTMLAVNPDPCNVQGEPYAILAIDTHFGFEKEVQKEIRKDRDAKQDVSLIDVCDMVFGVHDVIVVIRGTVSDSEGNIRRVTEEDYVTFLKEVVEKLDGIVKTTTMFVMSRTLIADAVARARR